MSPQVAADGADLENEGSRERDAHCEASPSSMGSNTCPPRCFDGSSIAPDCDDTGQNARGLRDNILSSLGIVDPAVDPSDPAFDFDKWSRTVAMLREQLGVVVPPRSGFVFKDLTVRGSGPAIGYQDTVWTCLESLFDVRRWSRSKGKRCILQGLEGVVQKGELLLILGRPGSGCTTFLKTITGHTHDLELDSDSLLEYKGTK